LGAGQTDLSDRPNRAAKPWRSALVQKYLYPRDSAPKMNLQQTRRKFIQQTGLGAAGFFLGLSTASARKLSANEKLNIGMIGVAHQAHYDLSHVSSENIVALCDVDDQFLAAAAQKYPKAKTYADFRRLLDQKGI